VYYIIDMDSEETLFEITEYNSNMIEKPKRQVTQRQLDALAKARQTRLSKKQQENEENEKSRMLLPTTEAPDLEPIMPRALSVPEIPQPKSKAKHKKAKPTIIQFQEESDEDSDEDAPMIIIRNKKRPAPTPAPVPAPAPAPAPAPLAPVKKQFVRRAY